MYKPSLQFERTPKEMKDIFKSWERSDQAFFAAGACHILADLFMQMHPRENFKMVHIKPLGGFPGNHAYVSNDEWAFDHNGWTKESELLETTEAAYRAKYPEWEYERIIIKHSATSLEDFCRENNHRLPWQYAYLPWERAYECIAKFDNKPPR